MGYYTQYSLDIKYLGKNHGDWHDLEERVMAATIPNDYGTVGELVSGGINCKWYDHDKDMKSISFAFPDVLFILEGSGEETDDRWKAYFLNGKTQRCAGEIRFPPFDASKLA